MNRRSFLKFLGAATVGSTVAYSFPSVIVPKNIGNANGLADAINKGYTFSGISDDPNFGFGFTGYKGADYIFDLIDKDLKKAIALVEGNLNLSFFGEPVTLEDIYNSHV